MTEKPQRLKVYVAGNPRTDKDRIKAMIHWIGANHTIATLTLDWLALWEETQAACTPPLNVAKEYVERREIALDDLAAVKECNVIVVFDSEVNYGLMTEFGAALALGKKIIVVDPKYLQVFFYHPNVTVVNDWFDATKCLEALHEIMTFGS